MEINGKKVGFAMTLGAIKDLCQKAPGSDIDRVTELFDMDDMLGTLDNMAWFIMILNKWYVYKQTRSFEGMLTEDDVYAFEIDEIRALFADALATFKKDITPETEVEGKKEKAAP